MEGLATVSELSPDFVRLHERADLLVDLLDFFLQPCEEGSVRWLDVGSQLRLVESPLDIAQAVQSKLLHSEPADSTVKAWIFTSATLGDEPKLRWFTEPCGLEGAEILRVESPFDYARQAALYVPRQLPKPADPSHSAQVAALVARLSPVIGGRTLVLTTTLRALRAISEALQQHFELAGGLEVLVQGQLPKRQLM